MGASDRAEAGCGVKGQLWRMSLPWERSGQEAGGQDLLVPFPHSAGGVWVGVGLEGPGIWTSLQGPQGFL